MKAFVYDKKTSTLKKTIKDVTCVYETDNRIIIDTGREEYAFDVADYKTTIYQN